MFFVLSQTDFAAYAEDNTPYVESNNNDEVFNMLEKMIQFSCSSGFLRTK